MHAYSRTCVLVHACVRAHTSARCHPGGLCPCGITTGQADSLQWSIITALTEL